MSSPEVPEDQREEEDAGNASLLSFTRQYAHYATVGIMFPVATALGFFIGYWIDGWLDTVPLFAIIGMFLGVAAAIRNLLQTVATDKDD